MTLEFERNTMPRIMMNCPTTGRPIFIGIRAFDQEDFETMQFSGKPVDCPACGEKYPWSKEDTYLESNSIHAPEDNPMTKYSCSFYLLLENKTLLESQRTIDSISDFLGSRSRGRLYEAEVLCVCGSDEFSELAGGAEDKKRLSVRILGPSDWNLPGETDPYWGPEIVRYFGIASRRSIGELVILIEPGRMIENPRALESAMDAVALDRRLLVVSHDLRRTTLPTSAVLADSAMGGSTTTAAGGYGVEAKKRLFGGVTYQATRREMVADVPWLLASIAAEFERDRQGTGRKVMLSHWA